MGPYRVVARLLGWRKIRFIREKFVSSSEGTSDIAGQIHKRGNYVLQGRISPRSITAQNGLFIFKPFLMWVHLSFPSIQQRPPDGWGTTIWKDFGPQKTLWRMPPDPQLTFYWYMAVLSHFQSCPTLWSHGLYPTRLLCPWDSSGKNNGVGCHFLLQEIFPTQRSNLCLLQLLHWQAGSLLLAALRNTS